MKKIPTLFVRDENDRRYVTPEVTPGCEWVLAGEGTATRKYDGTCILIRRDGMAVKAFARREVKAGKTPPPNFVEVEHDETTGKTVGWEPAEQSGFARWIEEALVGNEAIAPGTYELLGPKVNGNPEDYAMHVLVEHATAERYPAMNCPRGYDELAKVMTGLPWEGIVWHHPDGRMVKPKAARLPPTGRRFLNYRRERFMSKCPLKSCEKAWEDHEGVERVVHSERGEDERLKAAGFGTNGGVRCDVRSGPCACGAWH